MLVSAAATFPSPPPSQTELTRFSQARPTVLRVLGRCHASVSLRRLAALATAALPSRRSSQLALRASSTARPASARPYMQHCPLLRGSSCQIPPSLSPSAPPRSLPAATSTGSSPSPSVSTLHRLRARCRTPGRRASTRWSCFSTARRRGALRATSCGGAGTHPRLTSGCGRRSRCAARRKWLRARRRCTAPACRTAGRPGRWPGGRPYGFGRRAGPCGGPDGVPVGVLSLWLARRWWGG